MSFKKNEKLKDLAQRVYILQIISLVVGLTAVAGFFIGWLLTLVLADSLVLGLLYIWYIYRIDESWQALNDRKGLDDALL